MAEFIYYRYSSATVVLNEIAHGLKKYLHLYSCLAEGYTAHLSVTGN